MIARRWMVELIRPAGVVVAIAVLTKVLQFAGGALLALKFGAGHSTDAYLLAKSVPVGVYLILDSILYNAFVPVAKRWQDGHTRPAEVFGPFLWPVLMLSLLLTGLLAMAAPWLVTHIAPGSDSDTLSLAVTLLRLTALAILVVVPASFLKAVNACQGRYVLVSLDAFLMHGVLVLTLGLAPAAWGIWPVAASLPVSCLLLCTLQLAGAHRDIRLRRMTLTRPLLKQVGTLVVPLIFLNILQQSNILFMNGAVSYVGEGAITWLNFSYSIGQIPVAILDLVLLSTLFPFAAALSARGDKATFREMYAMISRLFVVLLIPFSVWLILVRSELVELALQRGRFDDAASRATAICLLGHGLAITPWALEALACRCLFALERHGVYLKILALRVALNVALCAFLVPRFGHLGVSMAFAASFLLGAMLAHGAVRRELGVDAASGRAAASIPVAKILAYSIPLVWIATVAVQRLADYGTSNWNSAGAILLSAAVCSCALSILFIPIVKKAIQVEPLSARRP